MSEEHKKIKAKIRRYERSLRNEQAERGFISDGYGKRYLLGPMYMQLGNVEEALESFEWFQQTFPDDVGEPFQYLLLGVSVIQSGKAGCSKEKACPDYADESLSRALFI